MDMFFSGFRAMAKRQAEETEARLARLEAADQTVSDRRTALYNRLGLATTRPRTSGPRWLASWRLSRLEADLRAARERCATPEEAAKAVTAKAQETRGELERLRRLESNHVAELKAARETGRKEVEDLSRRLKDVEEQSRALRDEVTSKSQELTDTAKRWVSQISALDRGLAGSQVPGFLLALRRRRQWRGTISATTGRGGLTAELPWRATWRALLADCRSTVRAWS
ncbi:hypothetical protein QYE76_066829 [Lolium multiflorum]|uniref:Uncharacterized protein n=1 Tax=Lolium multiflorum TaxID=4521 RepID=A0AAD8WCF1_LOLMU|nr:hypothetical protein QYE76_066829 [Lolium multiflorum]